jgi:hypothetical protein
VVVLCDATDRPLLVVVFEVQRGRDNDKPLVWKLYLAEVEKTLRVPSALVVYCPDPAIAGWCRRRVERTNGPSLPLRPLIFTPADVPVVLDEKLARAHPTLAILSAVCHAREPDIDQMFPAVLAAMRSVDAKTAVSYYDVVLSGLPTEARARWEAFMTITAGPHYRSELLSEVAAEHEAIGEARGEAYAILAVLESRQVQVPPATRERILACVDRDQLDEWVRRAANANSIGDVISG